MPAIASGYLNDVIVLHGGILYTADQPFTASAMGERGFLDDVSIPWDQQVAVMFQIVSALVLDVP